MVHKNWFNIFIFCFLLISSAAISQEQSVLCVNPEFQKEVNSYLSYDVPIISIADAYEAKEDYIFLDAREVDEYNISHIENAIHIGYDDFDMTTLSALDKSKPIIIYCSIGYRSERIGMKLQEVGFKNIQNLYGSIFEWVNQHHPIYDQKGKETTSLHTYNKKWSRWVHSEDIIRVW